MNMKYLALIIVGLLSITACQNTSSTQTSAKLSADSTVFYASLDNKDVLLYSLENEKIRVDITNFGARLVSLFVNDRKGQKIDVLLGYDKAEEYIKNTSNFYGAIVGRYGNRIANASFKIADSTYQLEKNNGEHSLHGGTNGVYNKVWRVLSISKDVITFEYFSPDGEAGYPGNVKMQVTYKLNNKGGLEIEYSAKSDKETVLNLTNHAYFNLNGEGDTTILDHILWVDANYITQVDSTLIPTGESLSVKGTVFDFTKPKLIGRDINKPSIQLKYGKGYDHNFELNKKDTFSEVAALYAPKTGIEMKVFTTEPGLQFYSGNFMSDTDPKGKGGKSYPYRSALCLETQHFPDSPNHSNFPSTELREGEIYTSRTEYRFSVRAL